ncbi:glutamyl-tRNA(Gln) amidotransferase subunit C, mitochondrial [Coccinella septempunctata]|uniref:glutamyl-tRNA(Gln) amidotransferase subunit C, mitochondrial n=1 Tax=Coccinella septempunctata TaxID=41139 RepID=UPI001D07C175|nr:glutamyl-tRNA(Gln) amidotransferase subunit C, mitochondrial [Coccinella septempunctata]
MSLIARVSLISSYTKHSIILNGTVRKSSKKCFKPIVRVQTNKIWNNKPQDPVKIDRETVNLLERLSLVDCANEKSLKLIENAVNFASVIHSVDTEGVEPLVTVLEDRPLALREDIVLKDYSKEEILQNAKLTEEDYFVVPPGNVPIEPEELFEKTKSN